MHLFLEMDDGRDDAQGMMCDLEDAEQLITFSCRDNGHLVRRPSKTTRLDLDQSGFRICQLPTTRLAPANRPRRQVTATRMTNSLAVLPRTSNMLWQRAVWNLGASRPSKLLALTNHSFRTLSTTTAPPKVVVLGSGWGGFQLVRVFPYQT
jgi:hypothetical protein